MREFVLDIYQYLNAFFESSELITVIMASLPIVEARYAILIIATLTRESLLKIYWLAVLGNMIPVVPLLLLFEPISARLRRFHIWRRFFDGLTERTRRKAAVVEKYEALGLILFVSVPLPVTGAWTGCFAATLFKIKFRHALIAIFLGVLISAAIVTLPFYFIRAGLNG